MQKYSFPSNKKEYIPKIYAYSDESSFPGQLKIGYTGGNVEKRIKEQHPIITPKITYKIE